MALAIQCVLLPLKCSDPRFALAVLAVSFVVACGLLIYVLGRQR